MQIRLIIYYIPDDLVKLLAEYNTGSSLPGLLCLQRSPSPSCFSEGLPFLLSRTWFLLSAWETLALQPVILAILKAFQFLHLFPPTTSQRKQVWKLFAIIWKISISQTSSSPRVVGTPFAALYSFHSLSPTVWLFYLALWCDHTVLISCSLFFLFLPTWYKFGFLFSCSRDWLWSKDRRNSVQWTPQSYYHHPWPKPHRRLKMPLI